VNNKDVIIRKEHWRRKKQWDFTFGFRTRPLNGANGERGVTLYPADDATADRPGAQNVARTRFSYIPICFNMG
jgi:hypothetical protein